MKLRLLYECFSQNILVIKVITKSHRGGTVVMVKSHLAQSTMNVDTSIEDQVWLRFQCMPRFVFGACYIPPSDSPHYSQNAFASIQSKLIESEGVDEYVIIGDLNARFGIMVRVLPVRAELPDYDNYSSPDIPDDTDNPNDTASVLASKCIDLKLAVFNNLNVKDKNFASKMTYKQGDRWVSELDICMVSHKVLNYIEDFTVFQKDYFPIHHVPVSLVLSLPSTDVDGLFNRAGQLDEHATLKHSHNTLLKKPTRLSRINHEVFADSISDVNCNVDFTDANQFAHNVAVALYECSMRSHEQVRVNSVTNVTWRDSRWDQLLYDRDDANV